MDETRELASVLCASSRRSSENIIDINCPQLINIQRMNSYLRTRLIELEAKLEDLRFSSSREIIKLDHEWNTTLNIINLQMSYFRNDLRTLDMRQEDFQNQNSTKCMYLVNLKDNAKRYIQRVFPTHSI